MSSIYDALKRSQGDKHTALPLISSHSPSSKKWYWAIFVSVIFSSACTIGILYAVGFLNGPEKHPEKITAQRTRVTKAAAPPQIPAASIPQAPAVDPDRIWNLMWKADRLHKKGDLEGAIDAYSELAAMSPASSEIQIRLGGLYYEAKQYDQALDIFTKALKTSPQNAKLLNNIGSVLLVKNNTADALRYFIQAHKNAGDYVEPLYNMACAYAKMKKNGAALSSLRQACMMQPEVRLWAKRDPDLQSLKGDKEFESIVRAQ
jgi:tetratricopeptide (TPR) repeat protein